MKKEALSFQDLYRHAEIDHSLITIELTPFQIFSLKNDCKDSWFFNKNDIELKLYQTLLKFESDDSNYNEEHGVGKAVDAYILVLVKCEFIKRLINAKKHDNHLKIKEFNWNGIFVSSYSGRNDNLNAPFFEIYTMYDTNIINIDRTHLYEIAIELVVTNKCRGYLLSEIIYHKTKLIEKTNEKLDYTLRLVHETNKKINYTLVFSILLSLLILFTK